MTESLIDPKLLAKLDDIELVCKKVAEGFLQGNHNSVQKGVGIEFSQYRSYEIGDPISQIDWKLFARSDRYFIREAERESDINVIFMLDSSASMAHQVYTGSTEQSENTWSKLDYAKHLIATVAYLAQNQGDSISSVILSDRQIDLMPAGNGMKQWQKLLVQLMKTKPQGQLSTARRLNGVLSQITKPSLIFFITDGYQHDDEIFDNLTKLDSRRSEVILLQLTSRQERQLLFDGTVRFKDLETDEEVLLASTSSSAVYQAAWQELQSDFKRRLKERDIVLIEIDIEQPLDHVLNAYFDLRRKQLGQK
ncbi:MAG: DUF58 domain-containing protein [Kangiellaceae bacterium]|jgi:uncharacterized protein (DUF58 family)|nr:DUF58 domain-containing protein [Kangiellaceae bacterium]